CLCYFGVLLVVILLLVVRSLCVVVLLRLGGVRGCPGPSRTCPCGGVGPPPLYFFLGAPGAPSGFCRRDVCFLHVLVVVALLFAAPGVALWLWASASHGVGWAGPCGEGFGPIRPLRRGLPSRRCTKGNAIPKNACIEKKNKKNLVFKETTHPKRLVSLISLNKFTSAPLAVYEGGRPLNLAPSISWRNRSASDFGSEGCRFESCRDRVFPW
ncbi:uncharacterized protein TM35_000181780, partial [Trypanosoma theileri]